MLKSDIKFKRKIIKELNKLLREAAAAYHKSTNESGKIYYRGGKDHLKQGIFNIKEMK